jgi:broad specificity phosphatase PhoE
VGVVWLARHGQTAYSRDRRHTGTSDIPLDETGEIQARALRRAVAEHPFGLVLTSQLRRARRTAELCGLHQAVVDEDLAEWDYGSYDGRTTPEIQTERPGWYLWDDGVPDGETLHQVSERADRVLRRIAPTLEHADVALVGHGHALRILAARWLSQPARLGAHLRLESGTYSVLGHEHGRTTVDTWNAPP